MNYRGKHLCARSSAAVIAITVAYYCFSKWGGDNTPNTHNQTATQSDEHRSDSGVTPIISVDRIDFRNKSPKSTATQPQTQGYDIGAKERIEHSFGELKDSLRNREMGRLTQLWSQDIEETQIIAISLNGPSVSEIAEISSDIASLIARVPESRKIEIRKRAQKLYDEFTVFPKKFRVVYGVTSPVSPNSITVTETDVDSLDDIKPSESGNISFHGKTRSRIESLDIVNPNSRYGYLFKREPESEPPSQK